MHFLCSKNGIGWKGRSFVVHKDAGKHIVGHMNANGQFGSIVFERNEGEKCTPSKIGQPDGEAVLNFGIGEVQGHECQAVYDYEDKWMACKMAKSL